MMATNPGQKTVLSTSLCPYLLFNNQGQELKVELHKPTYNLGRDRAWGNTIPPIPETWTVISSRHAILRKEGTDYCLFDGDGQNYSSNGFWREHRRIGTTQEGYLLQNGTQLEIGQDPQNYIILTYFNPIYEKPQLIPSKRYISLSSVKNWPVILGREQFETQYEFFLLDAPVVSRRHATITRLCQGGYQIEDCSTNGTFINGIKIDKSTLLKGGDKIQIGPFTLVLRQDILELFDPGNQIRLDAYNLLRTVKEKTGEKILLNNISLPIEPGQLVALVGGSGTGKSTLLKTLLSIATLNSGKVFLNGDDLQKKFPIYRSHIGYVPQDDIVHLDLRVEEVLNYACQLRLPPDTLIEARVEKTLKQVKLDFVRSNLVHTLSGGQRKRVSIGVELLADPKLFFLDEPTSGLDPGLDLEMMELLRELANQGRTIILVTHATANIEKCDRIAFLGRGGSLCYFGPPREAMSFFEMPAQDLKYFAYIYRQLEVGKTPAEVVQTVRQWRDKFKNSAPYQQYIQSVLSSPLQSASTEQLSRRHPTQTGISLFKQLKILAQRYARLVWRDRSSLILTLAAAPAGIALIALTLLGETPLAKLAPLEATQAPLALRVLFIFTCAAILVGLLSSVQEIVKEASIYARERLVNLGLFPYLGSKLLIRSGLAIIQSFLIVMIVLIGFAWPEGILLSWPVGLFGTTFLTIVASLCLGLLVSAWVKNETTANNSLSLLFLPQIILSGVLFDLQGWQSKLSWLTISRWSVGAYGALADVNGMVPPPQQVQTPLGIQEITPPFETSCVYDPTWQNLLLNWTVLVLQAVFYLSLTVWLQKSKDKIGKSR